MYKLETPYSGPVCYGLDSGGGQESDRARLESVYQQRPSSGPDPNRPHGREPGDGYILLSVLVGLVLGAAAGLPLGIYFDFSRYLGLSAGAIAGILVGFPVGDRFKKRLEIKSAEARGNRPNREHLGDKRQ